MIKNIVFDMGNVLRDYNPWYVIDAYIQDKADGEAVYQTVFKSEEWLLMDNGLMTEAEALDTWLERLPERLHGATKQVFQNWHLYMPNFDEVTELVRQLSEAGYGLYLLSNTSVRFSVFKEGIHAFKYMKGAIASAFHKVMKPDRRIYEILFETYGLLPEECFFVDDAPQNIEGARLVGMVGHRFTGDVDALIADLRDHGVAF